MVRPVNRCQSPISTANPNAVNVATPRMQPSRCTTGVNSLSAANLVIASSRRSRRSTTGQHRVEGRVVAQLQGRVVEPLARAATRSCSRGPGFPAGVDDPLSQKQFRDPMPGGHQIPAAVLAGPHQVPGGFLGWRWEPSPR